MKFVNLVRLSAVIAAAALVVSCLSTPAPSRAPAAPPQPQFYGANLAASHGESEIILHSTRDSGTLSVYLNGALRQNMLPQDSIKLIVPDGQHTILVNWVARDANGRNVPIEGEALSINVQSVQHTYSITLPALLGGSGAITVGRRVRLNQVSTNPLTAMMATGASRGIEGATIRASERLIPELPHGANVAVLGISAADRVLAQLAIEELELQLSRSRRFSLVAQQDLELIRAQQNLHLSGDISDNTAVSIGKIVGAGIVIVGNVTGTAPAQRLTLRALNAETGLIEAMEREAF